VLNQRPNFAAKTLYASVLFGNPIDFPKQTRNLHLILIPQNEQLSQNEQFIAYSLDRPAPNGLGGEERREKKNDRRRRAAQFSGRHKSEICAR
jgi:hypothetical protein